LSILNSRAYPASAELWQHRLSYFYRVTANTLRKQLANFRVACLGKIDRYERFDFLVC